MISEITEGHTDGFVNVDLHKREIRMYIQIICHCKAKYIQNKILSIELRAFDGMMGNLPKNLRFIKIPQT